MVTDNNPSKNEMGFLEQAFRATNAGGPMFLLMLVLIPFVILVKLVLDAPTLFIIVALILNIAGFTMFSIAKVSLYKQGHWLTFGSSLMTPRNRMLYRIGYSLMACAAAISLVFLVIGKMHPH